MWIRRIAILLTFLAPSWAVVAYVAEAQENPGPAATVALNGTVHTSTGIGVPGATLRAIQTSSGQAWVTWTDEMGKFAFPAVPQGRYRIEVSEIGFAQLTREIDLTQTPQTPLDLKIEIATLAALNANPVNTAGTRAQASAPATPTQANEEASNSDAPANSINNPANDSANNASPANRSTASNRPQSPAGGRFGGRGGQAGGRANGRGQGGPGQGAGRGAFQPLNLGDRNLGQQNPGEQQSQQDQSIGGNTEQAQQDFPDASNQLGQAASADAVQMIGTVAMGLAPDSFAGQFGPGGPGEFDGVGIPGAGGGDVIPGQSAPGLSGGGGPGGGIGGRGGGGFAQGGRGGRVQGGRGAQSVAALYGAQRLLRQRINRVHYSFYDTFGDTALNARPYSLTGVTPSKIPGWNETAGGNIGGPLKIPHIYDGTDKTFFFFNFEGGWSRRPIDVFSSVPTAAERAGDFSALNTQLYDPTTSGQRSLFSSAQCPQGAGTCIPQSMISQAALNLLQYVPLPNTPGTLNFHLQTNVPGNNNRFNLNITHRISAKLNAQIRYNLSNASTHSLNSFPGIESNVSTRGQGITIGLTQNLTKTVVNTTQLYFTRNRVLGLNEFSNLATNISAALGIAGVSQDPFDFGLPQIGFTNFTGLSNANPSLNRSQTYRLVDNVRLLKAKHTITFGGEVRKMEINRQTDPTPNGLFSFTGLMTSQLNTNGTPVISPTGCGPANLAVPCIGNDFADFLLGYPANTRVQFGDTSTYFRNWGFVGYASDDWHMTPKFTITYGLRYEAFTPATELYNHIVNLNVSSNFTQVQCVTPTQVGSCAGSPYPGLIQGRYNNWSPRLGIAWQPPGKWFSGKHQTTIRAGYSRFYVQSYINSLASAMANQPPFATANTATAVTTSNVGLLTLQNGLVAVAPNVLTNTIAIDPHYQVPYATVWNASVEYSLFGNSFIELLYTGTRGVHLDQLFGYSLANSGAANTTSNAAGFTYDTSGGVSILHSMQVRFQKRMSHGITFTTRYTYSKSLDDASTIGGGGQIVIQNNANPRGDYGLSSFDLRHQFNGNFTYQLPFGDRQRFATHGWSRAVLGAWRVSGSITARTGTPFTVRVFSKNPSCQNVPGVNSERADQTGSETLANPSVQEWFNTAAFTVPTGCFGDAARNSITGPGTFTMNASLSKTIQFGRDGLRRLDFTWNATNLLNHVNYSGISTVLGSSTFGQVTSVGAMRSMSFTTRVNF